MGDNIFTKDIDDELVEIFKENITEDEDVFTPLNI
tara:strand:+ start:81 stop:185 length:105 start_codon:yes stop_codon:yes gene_type:complete